MHNMISFRRNVVMVLIALAASALTKVPATQTSLTDDEKQAGWKLLFDGKPEAVERARVFK